MEHEIVQTCLQYLKHRLASDTSTTECALINAAELALLKSVVVSEFLLLNQTETIIGGFAAGRLWAMNTRAVVFSFQILGRAEDRGIKSPTDANTRTCISSHTL